MKTYKGFLYTKRKIRINKHKYIITKEVHKLPF